LHDALGQFDVNYLNNLDKDRTTGICDTSAHLFDEFKSQKSKFAVLIRPLDEINRSLAELDLPDYPEKLYNDLIEKDVYTIQYKNIFDYNSVNSLYRYLTGHMLDKKVFDILKNFNVQATYMHTKPDYSALKEIGLRLRGEL
jgi:hypothetical protein